MEKKDISFNFSEFPKEELEKKALCIIESPQCTSTGIVALYFPKNEKAFICLYDHCSCYGAIDCLNGTERHGTQFKSLNVSFEGNIEELIGLAERHEDPNFSGRKISEDDYDYPHFKLLYDEINRMVKLAKENNEPLYNLTKYRQNEIYSDEFNIHNKFLSVRLMEQRRKKADEIKERINNLIGTDKRVGKIAKEVSFQTSHLDRGVKLKTAKRNVRRALNMSTNEEPILLKLTALYLEYWRAY